MLIVILLLLIKLLLEVQFPMTPPVRWSVGRSALIGREVNFQAPDLFNSAFFFTHYSCCRSRFPALLPQLNIKAEIHSFFTTPPASFRPPTTATSRLLRIRDCPFILHDILEKIMKIR